MPIDAEQNTSGAKLSIAAEYVWRIDPFISHDPTRYYLNGFWVEPCPAGGVFIVATDGHKMGIFRDSNGTCDRSGIIRLEPHTVSACRNKMMTKGFFTVHDDTAWVHRDEIDRRFDPTQSFIASQNRVVVDGKFPDWRRVIPKQIPHRYECASYNAAYLRQFETACRDTSKKGRPTYIKLHASGPSKPVIVLSDRDDFFGVIMPVRMDDEGSTYPEWLR